MDFRKGYFMLFNAISAASEILERQMNQTKEQEKALQILRSPQEKAEDWYIGEEE